MELVRRWFRRDRAQVRRWVPSNNDAQLNATAAALFACSTTEAAAVSGFTVKISLLFVKNRENSTIVIDRVCGSFNRFFSCYTIYVLCVCVCIHVCVCVCVCVFARLEISLASSNLTRFSILRHVNLQGVRCELFTKGVCEDIDENVRVQWRVRHRGYEDTGYPGCLLNGVVSADRSVREVSVAVAEESFRQDWRSPRTAEMATLGLSKVFILDKYFTELQKFWETEKKLQGMSKGSVSMVQLLLSRIRSII